MLVSKSQGEERAERLLDLLSSPLAISLIDCHTNDLGGKLISPLSSHFSATGVTSPAFNVPESWLDWWDWAATKETPCNSLVELSQNLRYPPDYSSSDFDSDIPVSLRDIVSSVNHASLTREATLDFASHVAPRFDSARMSQKKHHEVTRMASYVFQMLDRMRDRADIEVKHVVDIGSGQVRSLPVVSNFPSNAQRP